MSIGENIRNIREGRGIAQVELAGQVGVTQSMLCQIERGTKACSMQMGADIARALGCTVMELYGAGAPAQREGIPE